MALFISSRHHHALLTSAPLLSDIPSSINIFKEAVVSEVIPFEMPLLSLATRLLQLLNEFPEQPILELLLKLVRRCLSLPARSPPARYLAGLYLHLHLHLYYKINFDLYMHTYLIAIFQVLSCCWQRLQIGRKLLLVESRSGISSHRLLALC
jgi:hypothetical protein